MSESHPLQRRLPHQAERLSLIGGAIISWVLVWLLCRVATARLLVFTSVLAGPCVLLLTYFAFGGDIPLKWRQKGYRRLMVVPIVFWVSFVAAVVVGYFERWP